MTADREALHDVLDDLHRAQSLMALLRWIGSHRDPPTEEAWAGLYIVTCDAEHTINAAEATIRRGLGRLTRP